MPRSRASRGDINIDTSEIAADTDRGHLDGENVASAQMEMHGEERRAWAGERKEAYCRSRAGRRDRDGKDRCNLTNLEVMIAAGWPTAAARWVHGSHLAACRH